MSRFLFWFNFDIFRGIHIFKGKFAHFVRERCIVFANTKHKCEEIWGYLAADGHRVGLLTGDVAQKKRLSLLKQFTDGELDILVATDVAARGLHISDVTHVFNFDLPDDREDYVHRIGRTGRAGESGVSISFAC